MPDLMRFTTAIVALFIAITLPAAGARAADVPPTYAQVHAIFAKHCISCHDAKEAKGELVMESFDRLMKGGEEGPVIVPGKASESPLITSIEQTKKPFMPPPKKSPKLSDAEIAIVRAWINAGAKGGDVGIASTAVTLPKFAPRGVARDPVNSMAFAAGPKLIALGRSGAVELRSSETRSLVRKLPGHHGNVNALAFNADGSLLYAAAGLSGVGGEVKVWKTADGSLVRTIEGHRDAIYALALSADGALLATGGYDQKIALWNAQTGAPVRTLEGHNGGVFGLSFRPDGKILASASADRTIKLWEIATGNRLDTFSEPTKEQYAVTFTPDGSRLLAGGADNRIRAWRISNDAKEGTNALLISQFAHDGSILRLQITRDGKTVVSSADNNSVKVWNAVDLAVRLELPPQSDWPTALTTLGDDKIAGVGRLDGSFDFYDLASGKVIPPPPPAKPSLSGAAPRGIQRGVAARITLHGMNLAEISAVESSNPALGAEVVRDAPSTADSVIVQFKSEVSVPLGPSELWVKTVGGESNRIKLYVDDIPQAAEAESSDSATPLALPSAIWGEFNRKGDADAYTFSAKKDQPIVFDVAAQRFASKAVVMLSISDAAGRLLASAGDTRGDPDPVLLFTPPADGSYIVRVNEISLNASPDHFYRLSAGHFPLVTGVFPLVVPPNAETTVKLIGYNLPADASGKVKSGPSGEVSLVTPNPSLRLRSEIKVMVSDTAGLVETEPNDQPSAASPIATNSAVDGRLQSPGEVDLYRFTAKAGQRLILETLAAQRGSPADTRIDVLYPDGRAVQRVVMRAVRDSAIQFRGVDANGGGARLDHWEEMELNQYLYLNGEVVKLFLYPRGPDSEFDFYRLNGKRRCYFDTSATAHPLDEPCYIVEPHAPGESLPPNGLPAFPIPFSNDDDADRKRGADSRLTFIAPADGTFLVRVADSRGFGGDAYVYRLIVRDEKPDFSVAFEGMLPTIPAKAGRAFTVRADRMDGFDGKIRVEVKNVPAGFRISSPLIIEAGHDAAQGTVFAFADAQTPVPAAVAGMTFSAAASIAGRDVIRTVTGFPPIAVAPPPKVSVELLSALPAPPIKFTADEAPNEFTIAPGQTVSAWLRVTRNGFDDRLSFDLENLPHGVIVTDIGLNGVLIPEKQTERQVFLKCAPWVEPMDRPFHAKAREVDSPTSVPLMLHVVKPK